MCYDDNYDYGRESVNYSPVKELVFNNTSYYFHTNVSTTTVLSTMWMSEFFKAYRGQELWIPDLVWRKDRPNVITTEHFSCNQRHRYFRAWAVFTPENVRDAVAVYSVQMLDRMRDLDLEVPDEEMFNVTQDPEMLDIVFVPCEAKNRTTTIPLGFIYRGQDEDGSLRLVPIMSKFADIYEHFNIVTSYPLDVFQAQVHDTIFDIDYGSIEYEDDNLADFELLSKLKFRSYAKHIRMPAFGVYGLDPFTAKTNPVLD